jgi:hypothetical protein
MVNNCANPQCAKPLHYLREGKIFVFDVKNRSGAALNDKRGHHLEHFWLCGTCSQIFRVEQETEQGVRLVPKRQAHMSVGRPTEIPTILAS